MPDHTLYFAYGALLDPDRINRVAPGASFQFIAHYPETKLGFVVNGESSGIPTLVKESGHTVWGGVFEIPGAEVEALAKAEEAEGRNGRFDGQAVDREGNKHHCLAFVSVEETGDGPRPKPDYLKAMIKGARHWSLPAGWIMGLEDLEEDPLFS